MGAGTATENEAVVRRLYAAMENGGDLEALLDCYADDIAWYAPKGVGPMMGERHGKAAMAAAMAYMGSMVTAFRLELIKLFADDEEVITVHRDLATRIDGAGLDTVVCCRWIVRDGRIAELWEYSNDPSVVDDFFAAP